LYEFSKFEHFLFWDVDTHQNNTLHGIEDLLASNIFFSHTQICHQFWASSDQKTTLLARLASVLISGNTICLNQNSFDTDGAALKLAIRKKTEPGTV
jgi:hypothetical protein